MWLLQNTPPTNGDSAREETTVSSEAPATPAAAQAVRAPAVAPVAAAPAVAAPTDPRPAADPTAAAQPVAGAGPVARPVGLPGPRRRPILTAAQLLGTSWRTCELLSGLGAVERLCRRGQRLHQRLVQTNWLYMLLFVYGAFVYKATVLTGNFGGSFIGEWRWWLSATRKTGTEP